jgi:hypothetical protein
MTLVPDFEVEMIVDYVMGAEDYQGTEYEDFRRRSEADVEGQPTEPEAEI